MNKPLILVVEDDPPVRNLITTTLKTNDYRYLSAANGETAIMEASSHNPDIVLLDLGLPDVDGVQVIENIRSWSNLPIIVISARSEDTDKIEALDAGADDYLTKPFSVEELLARLRVTQRRLTFMSAEALAAGSVFVNGKLRVDYAGGCAFLDGQELGQRRSLLEGVYGDAQKKAGASSGFTPVYPDPHWGGVSDDEGRVKNSQFLVCQYKLLRKSSGAFHIVWKAVFVNKKVKQKGSKKVSTLSTCKL